jgi:hypothetical protein
MGRLGPSSRDLSCARVSGKRNFAARDKCPETAPKVLGHPLQRIDMGKESRQLGAGLQGPGNLCECRNAWWAREDSNLQPSGYEHPNSVRESIVFAIFAAIRPRPFSFGCCVPLVIHWLARAAVSNGPTSHSMWPGPFIFSSCANASTRPNPYSCWPHTSLYSL